jgi:hypothetical protein
MKKFFNLCLCLVISFVLGCSSEKKELTQQTITTTETQNLTDTPIKEELVSYQLNNDKSYLDKYYEEPHIKEWYPERKFPPMFDFNMDLSTKSYVELRLLRNEIFARNGYLFNEATLRGYFNQFEWYQPIFDIPEFQVSLSEEEHLFIQKVLALETAKSQNKIVQVSQYQMINFDNVVNSVQFKTIPKSLETALREKNFALVAGNHEQMFYVYDQNQYNYIPNFITTDLYLQVLHKYQCSLLKEIEEEKLIPVIRDLLKNLQQKSINQAIDDKSPLKDAAIWANAYLSIGLTAINGENQNVDASMKDFYDKEIKEINLAEGISKSEFLGRELFDYSQFKPRGNYTTTEDLKKYFRCVKWLNSASILLDDETKFNAALLIGFWIINDNDILEQFNSFNVAIKVFAGEEDNFSISHVIKALNDNQISKIEDLLNPEKKEKIKKQLSMLNVDRIRALAGDELATKDFSKKYILFSAGRYTFDAEIFTRLVHILRPQVKRPIPKVLDIFAALGNQTAEKILQEDFQEGKKWSGYTDSLNILKKEFLGFNQWNLSIYNKSFQGINALINNPIEANHPLFMKTDWWQKKNLQTASAAYSELKHLVVLYAEQPFAAEAGQGGGPQPPQFVSYVEPNLYFWNACIELLNFQEKILRENDLMTENGSSIHFNMKELAEFFLKISRKELSGEKILDEEFGRMKWIGGEVERLTLSILKTDHLPERDKTIAQVTDIYTYNKDILETAIGLADEIYVVVEINGLPYLTKGACFSYYEFIHNVRLTDEEWQQILSSGKAPSRPEWIKNIYVNSPPLETTSGYSF